MTKSDINKLRQIKSRSDIHELTIGTIYEDDHQMCTECTINGIKVEFLWYDSLGFLEYWQESDKAFNNLITNLNYTLNMVEEENN